MPITIEVPGDEVFDETTEKFVYTEGTVLVLEHSLVSLSKWESIFHKAFLGREEKTVEETLAYIHAMCLDENIPGEVLYRLTKENLAEINAYIENPMTATTFSNIQGAPSREIITNELIRSWMVGFQIPLDYETRHLNQLFTLIKVINEQNKPKKKMSPQALAARNRELNEARRKAAGTTG